MSEWWTYDPSDFLLFSARTWYRLIGSYNADLWPLHLVAVAIGLLLVTMVATGRDPRGRRVATGLAFAWIAVGLAFHVGRHAQINWAAPWFAGASFVQAALLLIAAFVGKGLALRHPKHMGDRIALGIALLAIVAYPAIAPIAGRGTEASETFGLMPDPTAVASVALLSVAQARRRGVVLAIPMLLCAVASLFLHTLHAPEWPVPFACAFIAWVAGSVARRTA